MNSKLGSLFAALLLTAANANANVISTDVNITAANPFQYVHFSVTTAGVFNISADGADTFGAGYNTDPQIYLFQDSLSLGNDIYENDDIIGGSTLDSLISDADLVIGNYILAVSQAFYFAPEAVSGIHLDPVDAGRIHVSIQSADGNAVPEPASLALMALGLVGLASTRRKQA